MPGRGSDADEPVARADRRLGPEPARGPARRPAGGAARARRARALAAGCRGAAAARPGLDRRHGSGWPAPRVDAVAGVRAAPGAGQRRPAAQMASRSMRDALVRATISSSPAAPARGSHARDLARDRRAPTRSTQDAEARAPDRAGGAAGRPAADRRRALRSQPASRREAWNSLLVARSRGHASWRTTTSATWCRSASSCRCATCSAASGSRS